MSTATATQTHSVTIPNRRSGTSITINIRKALEGSSVSLAGSPKPTGLKEFPALTTGSLVMWGDKLCLVSRLSQTKLSRWGLTHRDVGKVILIAGGKIKLYPLK
jgi:hypothetical protein